MNHDPLCKAPQYWHSPGTAMATCQCDLIAKVRADQDNRECDHCTDLARLKIANLRAKVEALPARGVVHPYDIDSLVPETLLYRSDVLALIDGSNE